MQTFKWAEPIELFESYQNTQSERLFGATLKVSSEVIAKAINYSLNSKGKRFRPMLSMLVAQDFGAHPKRVLPWALAIEMIHTYSLIHDDLPCMDNDDFRRGAPTNHKVFGESFALLAGDALLTEAFGLIVEEYNSEPTLAVSLTALLVKASGVRGMITGQCMDLESKEQKVPFEKIKELHRLKTGALIDAAVQGSALALGLKAETVGALGEYAAALGLAFQIKDDLLDQDRQEVNSYLAYYSKAEVEQLLLEQSEIAKRALAKAQLSSTTNLHALISFNLERKT